MAGESDRHFGRESACPVAATEPRPDGRGEPTRWDAAPVKAIIAATEPRPDGRGEGPCWDPMGRLASRMRFRAARNYTCDLGSFSCQGSDGLQSRLGFRALPVLTGMTGALD